MHQFIIIQIYFHDFQTTKTKKDIHNYNYQNFNKTKFKVNIKQDQLVITKNKLSHLYINNLENCKYLSFFKYIGRKKEAFFNMLILNKK